uniref:Uncharacterized protein n=1 Tax=Heterorhabditis bacteriophora TaxID=37862 RepID=A0A1I7XAI8_HETBA
MFLCITRLVLMAKLSCPTSSQGQETIA